MRTDPKHVAPGTPHAERTGTINHLRLTVSDIARAKAFYHPVMERLGYLLVEESRTRLAWASWAPHGTLHWFIMSVANPDSPNKAHDRYSAGFHHLAWNVGSRAEVDGFHDFLLARGVQILDPPAEYDYEPGYYAFFFSDPDDLKLEIMHVDVAGSLAYWRRFSKAGAPLTPLEISEPLFVRAALAKQE
ncbi:VOC family protein [Bradyrhizobium elkanii]|uniref:Glyoxylase I family protein n=1 Tax=Bradyrhizobium elkanii TaxID=29448 RepID=A0ABV4EWH2_BRAEL|nr:VOC family protein [Bradyrhizobium elkanii]MBP2427990.1 catechol 2,3-dioxygenase-like lactoylglutathione lyase family enzyme [Bradyrhizobium elkanii]MCP1756524.1 catechol 2,3-dioxygenase-like lactoylglutathione lyase family enzyme [Bradyrhizobium elkanii]MCP1971186.1 catechol 2,3-dioxygenase-like lactoylglutathione lyase family enzyme [Bradyrhizobium elkanii]MCP1982037.1 catechol 2,3-dioxygenase-like lactoylglutathione lyase family enzyme [Bradyrhizobium elkanii]MCS3883179.1 catechol 2,3-di